MTEQKFPFFLLFLMKVAHTPCRLYEQYVRNHTGNVQPISRTHMQELQVVTGGTAQDGISEPESNVPATLPS